jgi:hypothetical protein
MEQGIELDETNQHTNHESSEWNGLVANIGHESQDEGH